MSGWHKYLVTSSTICDNLFLKRFCPWLLAITLLLTGLFGCSTFNTNTVPTPTPLYSLPKGGACVTLGQHPQAPYANVQVSHDTYPAHSEPMLAEDPSNPLHLVGGSKFFTNPAHYIFQIGSFASFDGGCTWRDNGVLPGFPKNVITSDVSFAFGDHNTVYVSVLYTAIKGNLSGISVSASRDGGKTFDHPVSVFEDKTGHIFNDKPWIAVDQTSSPHHGSLYVFWSYDHGQSCGGAGFCQQELAFSRSTDGGKTFSRVRLVEGNASFCTDPVPGRSARSTACDEALGAIPVVRPDGTLAVGFSYSDPVKPNIPTRMLVVTSPDGGDTWASPVLAATIHDIGGTFPHEKYRVGSLPAFADDPKTGQLYLAWSDKGPRDADILLSTSKDRGQTWARPIRVNDDPTANGANQFQPQLAVSPNGIVSVSFFDTRVDPHHLLIDVYLAQSRDHGASFLKNVRVTTQGWNPAVAAPTDFNGLQFIGDYQGLSADAHFAHPFWNDTRTGRQEIFTAAVPSIH